MATDFFFVYGTLKKDGLYAAQFNKYRISSEKATANNLNLYRIGWFPAAIPGDGIINGELHEYRKPDIVIKDMNRIEGCNGSEQDLFKRKRWDVITESGKEIRAIIYLFNRGTKRVKLIKDGTWINKTYRTRVYEKFVAWIRNSIKSIIWNKTLKGVRYENK